MKNIKFASSVKVIDPATGHCINRISRKVAATQYSLGIIKPHLIHDGFVHAVKELAPNTPKPGSFGIARELVGGSHTIFQHKNTYAEVLNRQNSSQERIYDHK